MVENFKKKYFQHLLDYLKNNYTNDFYLTESNKRIPVRDEKLLKKLFNQSTGIKFLEENGDVIGIILLWKSLGNNLPRYYIKLTANSVHAAKQLLTVLLWNENRNLFIKIRKDSPFIRVFKEKGFIFSGDRGKEILFFLNNRLRTKNDKPFNENKEFTER